MVQSNSSPSLLGRILSFIFGLLLAAYGIPALLAWMQSIVSAALASPLGESEIPANVLTGLAGAISAVQAYDGILGLVSLILGIAIMLFAILR